jgi:hypothetical protein
MSRFLRCVLGVVTVVLAAAGCGGGGGGDAASPALSPQPAAPVAGFAQTQESVSAAPATLSGSPGPGNMVSNGGFDSGMAGWVDWGHASTAADSVGSGGAALVVGAAAGGAGQEIGGILPGNTYRLAARARVSAPSETVYIGVNFLDASGAPLTQNSVLVNSTAPTTAGLDVVAPPNAVRALVYAWKNAGSGVAYVDDVALESSGVSAPVAPASANLVADGGFEGGLASWDAWSAAGTSTVEAAAGTRAAQVGTDAGGFGQDVHGIVPGNSYRVTALGKVGSPGEIGYLGVMFTDDAGTGLSAQNVAFRSTTYATVQADVTAPANATRAKVFVWKNAGEGFAYVDEVTLVQLRPAP